MSFSCSTLVASCWLPDQATLPLMAGLLPPLSPCIVWCCARRELKPSFSAVVRTSPPQGTLHLQARERDREGGLDVGGDLIR